MLISNERLVGYPILSLHVGGMIARVTELVVDPNKLSVVAFRLAGPDIGNGEVGEYLPVAMVREFSELGMVVDSADDFVDAGDVVALRKALDIGFVLVGKLVESRKGSRLGHVSSFMVNSDGFLVQQMVVERPFLKSFLDSELVVGRSEVSKITDEKIIVKDEESKIKAQGLREDFVPNFVNPFRASTTEIVTLA